MSDKHHEPPPVVMNKQSASQGEKHKASKVQVLDGSYLFIAAAMVD